MRHVDAERGRDVREAALLLQLLSRLDDEPLAQRRKVEAHITDTAKVVCIDRQRAADIWWQQARRIDAWEMDALRNAVRERMRRPSK